MKTFLKVVAIIFLVILIAFAWEILNTRSQQKAVSQAWDEILQAEKACSGTAGDFNIREFANKMDTVDRSRCPSDWQAAFKNWVSAVHGIEQYRLSDAAGDLFADIEGERTKATQETQRFKSAFAGLAAASLKYGVTLK